MWICTFINIFFYIWQKCHVKNKDIRKFLDGIYVSEKGTVTEEWQEQQQQLSLAGTLLFFRYLDGTESLKSKFCSLWFNVICPLCWNSVVLCLVFKFKIVSCGDIFFLFESSGTLFRWLGWNYESFQIYDIYIIKCVLTHSALSGRLIYDMSPSLEYYCLHISLLINFFFIIVLSTCHEFIFCHYFTADSIWNWQTVEPVQF